MVISDLYYSAENFKSISVDQILEFKKIFDDFDLDGNNSICGVELEKALKLGTGRNSDSKFEDLLKMADCDESGGIEFDEFLVLMSMIFQKHKQYDQLMEILKNYFKCFIILLK